MGSLAVLKARFCVVNKVCMEANYDGLYTTPKRSVSANMANIRWLLAVNVGPHLLPHWILRDWCFWVAFVFIRSI